MDVIINYREKEERLIASDLTIIFDRDTHLYNCKKKKTCDMILDSSKKIIEQPLGSPMIDIVGCLADGVAYDVYCTYITRKSLNEEITADAVQEYEFIDAHRVTFRFCGDFNLILASLNSDLNVYETTELKTNRLVKIRIVEKKA